MVEYFVGANVYQRLHWVLDRIEDQTKTLERAANERMRLRKMAQRIIENRDDEKIAIWFAEECARRYK